MLVKVKVCLHTILFISFSSFLILFHVYILLYSVSVAFQPYLQSLNTSTLLKSSEAVANAGKGED